MLIIGNNDSTSNFVIAQTFKEEQMTMINAQDQCIHCDKIKITPTELFYNGNREGEMHNKCNRKKWLQQCFLFSY